MREHGIDDWRELQRRSQDDIGWFWDAVVQAPRHRVLEPYERVFDDSRRPDVDDAGSSAAASTSRTTASTGTPATRPTADRGRSASARTARSHRHLRRAEARVNRLANGLLELGVGAGDAVGAVHADGRSRWWPASTRSASSARSTCRSSRASRPRRRRPAGRRRARSRCHRRRRCRAAARPAPMKPTVDEALAAAPAVRHVIVCDRLGAELPMTRRPRPCVGRAGRRARADRLEAPRARPGDADDGHLHVRHHRPAQGRGARARRVPGQDRRRSAPTRPTSTPDDVLNWVTDMGWIMGP